MVCAQWLTPAIAGISVWVSLNVLAVIWIAYVIRTMRTERRKRRSENGE